MEKVTIGGESYPFRLEVDMDEVNYIVDSTSLRKYKELMVKLLDFVSEWEDFSLEMEEMVFNARALQDLTEVP